MGEDLKEAVERSAELRAAFGALGIDDAGAALSDPESALNIITRAFCGKGVPVDV